MSDAQLEGTVRELLPRALYRVAVNDGREVIAHTAARRNFVRLIVGDRVLLELSSRDTGRGRIVRQVR